VGYKCTAPPSSDRRGRRCVAEGRHVQAGTGQPRLILRPGKTGRQSFPLILLVDIVVAGHRLGVLPAAQTGYDRRRLVLHVFDKLPT
jgi:hypothetical protein